MTATGVATRTPRVQRRWGRAAIIVGVSLFFLAPLASAWGVSREPVTSAGVDFSVATPAGTVEGVAAGAIGVVGPTWEATDAVSPAPPAGLDMPYGVIDYDIEVADPGDTVTVTLTFPTPVSSLWKLEGPTWLEIPAARVSDSGLTVAYELTDGGVNDEDGTMNRVIVDPVAPVAAAPPPEPTPSPTPAAPSPAPTTSSEPVGKPAPVPLASTPPIPVVATPTLTG